MAQVNAAKTVHFLTTHQISTLNMSNLHYTRNTRLLNQRYYSQHKTIWHKTTHQKNMFPFPNPAFSSYLRGYCQTGLVAKPKRRKPSSRPSCQRTLWTEMLLLLHLCSSHRDGFQTMRCEQVCVGKIELWFGTCLNAKRRWTFFLRWVVGLVLDQCDQIWRNLAKIWNDFDRFYMPLGKFLLIAVIGQKLSK